jgi:hypothetical protein
MAGKINCFSLGEKGVNVVKSPLHLDDGELVSAQNAEFFRNRGRGGIRKRAGLARFNGSTLGSVARFINVPLPATPVITLWAAVDGTNTEIWLSSVDGTTWLEAAAPVRAARTSKRSGANLTGYPIGRLASLNGTMYFPADDYVQYPTANHQAPPIRFYSGAFEGEVCQVPNSSQVGDTTNAKNVECMTTLNGTIYITTYDGASSGAGECGRVFQLDVRSGSLIQIGAAFGDGPSDINPGVGLRPFSLGWCAGRLFVGMINDSGSTLATSIYSIRPNIDQNWTLETTLGTNVIAITSMQEYQGKLYAATVAGALVQAAVQVRGSDGSWAVSETTAVTASTYKGYKGLCVYGDDLYVGYNGDGADKIRKLSAGAWSTDKDLDVLFGAGNWNVGEGLVIPTRNELYYCVAAGSGLGGIIQKKAGVWTIAGPFTSVIGSVRGTIGYTVV